MRIFPSENGKGFDIECTATEQNCKLCNNYVEAPCHICFSGLKGLLCKRCEPPIEFYNQSGGVLKVIAANNLNLPRDIPVSKENIQEQFKCGCSHTDAADSQASIVECLSHPRINLINGKSVEHSFEAAQQHMQPESIFKEVEGEQQEERQS